jgi:hypothetical protein
VPFDPRVGPIAHIFAEAIEPQGNVKASDSSLETATNLTAGLMMRRQVQETSVAALQLDRDTEDDPHDRHRDHPPPRGHPWQLQGPILPDGLERLNTESPVTRPAIVPRPAVRANYNSPDAHEGIYGFAWSRPADPTKTTLPSFQTKWVSGWPCTATLVPSVIGLENWKSRPVQLGSKSMSRSVIFQVA